MKLPLLVQLVHHPSSTEGEAVAKYLHNALNEDAAVPGLRVPTVFAPQDGLKPPAPEIPAEADRVLVIVLADDHLAAQSRQPAGGGLTWGEYVVRLRELCELSPMHRFMPVQLTEHGWPIDPRLEELNFLRAWAIENEKDRLKFIARRMVHLLIRRLRPHLADEDAPALTIFLSHTKIDLDNEPQVVKSILAHLTATQPEKTWFDTGDIASGSRFAQQIERGVSDAAMLAVVTDSYASRAWCRREVLLAKSHQRPVVVVNAIQEREIRSFPYMGNVPVIRWRKDPQDVVDLLLRETLRHAYAEASLNKRKQPGDDVMPAGPELVTLVHRDKTRPVLYPDPPLGAEELAVLEATGIRIETPLERHARANDLRTRSVDLAISASEALDVKRFGLRPEHFDAGLLELSRYLLLAGVRLMYGGHLGAKGYTIRLAELVRDPIVEQLRGKVPIPTAPDPELVVYVAWPRQATVHDEARLGPLVDTRRCDRPDDVDEQMDPIFVPFPAQGIPLDSPVRRFAIARGLTEMRRRQTRESIARLAIGGSLGGENYTGRMPGVLEEVVLSIQDERPVFLIGAFGGCARLIVDTIRGEDRPELTWEYQRKAHFAEEMRAHYIERKQDWIEYDELAALLRQQGMGGMRNGLTEDENMELGTTRSVERIVELVLLGLQRLYPADGGSSA